MGARMAGSSGGPRQQPARKRGPQSHNHKEQSSASSPSEAGPRMRPPAPDFSLWKPCRRTQPHRAGLLTHTSQGTARSL